MKKFYGLCLIIIFALCLTFCSCDESTMSPWGEANTENNGNETKTYTVYVYGAVANEGYYKVSEGETYYEAIAQAGVLQQSYLPSNSSAIVSADALSIVVHYKEDGVVHDCINANHESRWLRLPREGLSLSVINKIADYLEAYGTIPNKKVLREVLGDEDYENYNYKLYIAEADYEETD